GGLGVERHVLLADLLPINEKRQRGAVIAQRDVMRIAVVDRIRCTEAAAVAEGVKGDAGRTGQTELEVGTGVEGAVAEESLLAKRRKTRGFPELHRAGARPKRQHTVAAADRRSAVTGGDRGVTIPTDESGDTVSNSRGGVGPRVVVARGIEDSRTARFTEPVVEQWRVY